MNRSNAKLRPVILKFVRYNEHKKLFSNKKKLKGLGDSTAQSLRSLKMKKMKQGKAGVSFLQCFDDRRKDLISF